MTFVRRAAWMAVLAFLSALLGFGARATAPDLIAASKPMIGSIVSLLALLLSLVLGLLIWTSHDMFTDHQALMQTVGRSFIRLDLALRRYGADAAPGIAMLKILARRTQDRFWSQHAGRRLEYPQLREEMIPMRVFLDSLRPANAEQKERLDAAMEYFSTAVETQVTMIRGLVDPVPSLLLTIVGGWALALFFAYGLQSPLNALTLFLCALGAAAVASAVFLILEMSHPYLGLMTMSQTGFDRFLESLDELAADEARGA